jgi:hypothetical protein
MKRREEYLVTMRREGAGWGKGILQIVRLRYKWAFA